MNMGAGRVVYQDLTRIDKSIRDGELVRRSPTLAAAMDRCAGDRHALHLVGLLSDGGVHSSQQHLHALIEMAARHRVARVFMHVITDGRDTSPTGWRALPRRAQAAMRAAGIGRVASVVRPLLRDGSRQALGAHQARLRRDDRRRQAETTAAAALPGARRPRTEAGVTDEFVKPIVVVDADQQPVGPIRDSDSIIFFNFRADRARQITRAIALDDFDGFPRPHRPRVHYTTMTVYDRTFGLPVVFTPQTFSGNLADVLAEHGRTNLRLAETEKYAHVTYFFNCGREAALPGRGSDPGAVAEGRDLRPQAGDERARHRRRDGRRRSPAGQHQVVICNFANADMVGHTGDVDADDRRGRDARCLPRPDPHRARGRRRPRASSPPITATPNRCGTTS